MERVTQKIWQLASIYTRANRWAKNGVLDKAFIAF